MQITKIELFLAISGIFLVPFTTSFHSAHAAETSCDFSAPLENLHSVVNDATLGDREQLIKELGLRKQILGDIVNCAINEAASTKNNLVRTAPQTSATINLQTQFLNQIDVSLSYYDLKKSMIVDLGIQGTKNFANDLEAWRKSSEMPLETQISTFLLWNQNQPLVGAAQNRFTQISHTLTGLDLSNNVSIAKELLDAKNQLAQAVNHDNQAETLIENNDPVNATMHIAQSLEALKNVYQDFFSLSDLVQKAFTPK